MKASMNFKKITVLLVLICSAALLLFVHTNYEFYTTPIGKITAIKENNSSVSDSNNGNEKQLFSQDLTVTIMNGTYKNKQLLIENTYSLSGANDYHFAVGDEVFLQPITNDSKTGIIKEVKRDKFVAFLACVFILVLVAVGGKKGLLSAVSLIVNILILLVAMYCYTQLDSSSLVPICALLVLLFTPISLLLVSGNHPKTYTAIIATLLGTFSAFLIAAFVLHITNEKGLRYEEMAFITRSPQRIFLASILIGSLGAVMDIAITMASSMYELYEKDPDISSDKLIKSGLEIGKDIMGTMINILFFAYVSGAIPMILLYLKNGAAWGYTISMTLSLEIARALAGSIGIVLTIPIGLYTSLFFIERGRKK